MELYNFYKGFAQSVEFLFVVPLCFGLWKWNTLEKGMQWIVVLLFCELLINIISFYYNSVLHKNTLFLSYYYSFCWLVTLLGFFYLISGRKGLLSGVLIAGLLSLGYEYYLFGGNGGMNYYSGLMINFLIFLLSCSYFFNSLNNQHTSTSVVLILLALVIQFFTRTVDIFLKKYLLDSPYYTILWYYETIIYYYVMLLSLVIYSVAFYSLKK